MLNLILLGAATMSAATWLNGLHRWSAIQVKAHCQKHPRQINFNGQ